MRDYVLLLSTTIAAAAPLHAQEAPVELDGIVLRIEEEAAQNLLGNAQIDEAELEARNPATMADVFAGEASVTASGGAAIAQRTFVNGIEESLLSVTIDGARQNKSAFHHTGNILLDPALLKRVDIGEGIAPADAGPGGLGGSISYTTKDARDLLAQGDTFGGRTQIRGGDNGSGLRFSQTLFGRQDKFEWLLSGTRHSGSDYDGGDGAAVPGTEPELTDYIAKMAFTTDTGHRLSFSASRTEDDGLRVANPGPAGLYFIRPGFENTFGRGTIVPGPFQLERGLSRRTSYALTYTDERGGVFAPEAQLSYNVQEIDVLGAFGENTSLSGFLKNDFQTQGGTVTAGIDFFDDTAEGAGRGPGPFGSSGSESLSNVGIFAQARQDIGDRFSVSYGARYDWQDFEGSGGHEFKDSGLSVNAAIDVRLSDTLSLNAGLASTWGGYELGEAAIIDFGTAWTYPGFKASRANTGRLGLRYESGPWTAGGAVFRTDIDDLAERTGVREPLYDIEVRGYELTLGYDAAWGFARANFTRADLEENGSTIGTTAFYRGRPTGSILALEAAYDVNSEWTLGGTAEIALENDSGGLELPAYEVFNVYGSYRPKMLPGVDVRLDVQNLFDETYVARNSDAADGGLAVPLNNPGRTISLTASIDF
ncbi:TonB-dependent receptor domain-containing protein [Jannaschia sp. 2305UL9-9]|uniref:TonB-dependent receptor domain-containing protein n=1 Tax=Jannaschia sp. 2305UL9-9 TaxID=3121638 RepID=UPI0035296D80